MLIKYLNCRKTFKVVASSENSKFAIVESKIKHNFYGVQFHPEVTHTNKWKKNNYIISFFIICKIKKNWSSKDQKVQLD